MRKAGATLAPISDISGVWDFQHAGDRFRGTITLRQTGAEIVGTWHTTTGKTEADTDISGRAEGDTVYLRRFLGDEEQQFVLTISPGVHRIDGFGCGWSLDHTDLNLRRSSQKK